MAFRNGCCCRSCCFHVLNLCAPLGFSARCTVCLLSVPDVCYLFPDGPVGCLWPLARNVSASYTFYKDIKYEIYGMCDCDMPCIWVAGEARPIDTMPSNALLLFVVDSSAYLGQSQSLWVPSSTVPNLSTAQWVRLRLCYGYIYYGCRRA